MNELLDTLSRGEAGYQPGAAVTEQLGQVVMAPLIGPVAVGKSTCMDFVVGIDSEFGRVQSFTTRQRRLGEAATEFRFLEHSED